jgi:hypothetical protein
MANNKFNDQARQAPKFIIGFGERLAEPIRAPRRGGGPVFPYTTDEARARLNGATQVASALADQLDPRTCPNDKVVVKVTLHPSFLAKSYFPDGLLGAAGFQALGSRPTSIIPEKAARRVGTDEVEIFSPGEPRPTTSLYAAASRSALRTWSRHLGSPEELTRGEETDIVKIEDLRLPNRSDRLRSLPAEPGRLAEYVLHSGEAYVLRAFTDFAEELGAEAFLERRIDTGGTCFVPVAGTADTLESLADFTFVRTVRAMPGLRRLRPSVTALRSASTSKVDLPDADAADPDLRVAIFDGGLPEGHPFSRWVDEYDFAGSSVPKYEAHGQEVTSALLFGHITPGIPLEAPPFNVDHYRVLDSDSQDDVLELYDVIERIDTVLSQKEYQYISLSIGPDLPVEDDEVHAWTAFLDQHLAPGDALATVAVGNNGELDSSLGLDRISVPGDCVNALAVGASSSASPAWCRASYSAVGPGRSPGVIKPDVIAFGGNLSEPFITIDEHGFLVQSQGTSLAAPSTMRLAAGARSRLGSTISPLAARALIIHCSLRHPVHPKRECGWGLCPPSINEMTECGTGEARILFQGELDPSKYVRMPIPVPTGLPSGNLEILATLVYATDVDPQDPSNYTRAGIEITFRPHAARLSQSGSGATKPFFGSKAYRSEAELRSDAHKWETVLNDSHTFRTSSLNFPAFDLHYNARDGGGQSRHAPRIKYAMVLTLRMRKHATLYEDVLATYTRLEVLSPTIRTRIDI